MTKSIDRAELVELARKRAALAQYLGFSYIYKNHCWNCQAPISSEINARCPGCKLFICNYCGACFCDRAYTHVYVEAGDPFLPDYPDDLS